MQQSPGLAAVTRQRDEGLPRVKDALSLPVGYAEGVADRERRNAFSVAP
jgi:hypothetical protein